MRDFWSASDLSSFTPARSSRRPRRRLALMAILSVVLAQITSAAASYDTCETQWAVYHFDPATAKITRNNLGGRWLEAPASAARRPAPRRRLPSSPRARRRASSSSTSLGAAYCGDLHIRNTTSYLQIPSSSAPPRAASSSTPFEVSCCRPGRASSSAASPAARRPLPAGDRAPLVARVAGASAGGRRCARRDVEADTAVHAARVTAPTAAAAPSPALDLDVETSIVDDDETRETAPLSPAASRVRP